MTAKRREHLYLGGLFVFLFFLFTILPFTGQTIFVSPDETSYALVAKEIALHGQAYISDSMVRAFPWVHPRSWVSVSDHLAPIGFFGWSWVLSFFYHFGGLAILPWIGSLFLLSSAWPFFQLLKKKFTFDAAWWGTLIAFTVPSVILYANRSLFPNTPFLALSLWILWLVDYVTLHPTVKRGWYILMGVCSVLLFSFRPIEFIWFAPWLVWFGRDIRPTRRHLIEFVIGALIIFIPLAALAHGAYGSVFGFGYGRSDRVASIQYQVSSIGQSSATSDTSYALLDTVHLPFGFHPHAILWNVRVYFGWILLPWTFLSIGCLVQYLRRRKTRARARRRDMLIVLSGWTVLILLVIYGSGVYLDRFGPMHTATIGNSFLRYLLPLAPLVGLAFAFLWRQYFSLPTYRRWGMACGIFLVMFGMYRGLLADDEGVLATRRAIQQYPAIRQAASHWFQPGDIILSERSDKIFFPLFRGVSPLPSMEQIQLLSQVAEVRIGLFSRPLSQAQKDAWLRAGLEAQELLSFPREKLYRLVRVRS